MRKQADYEVGVIMQMGFPGYFLVVADFINWSKNNGIRVGPGRGSGAGSMAAYAMRITDLDPLQHGLIFERFLNPDRVSMPDFDVDFDERRRGEVIRYVTEKYGDERVAQIVTYGTIKAKQALKDSSPRARLPVRHGREAHQGDAAGRSWARTSRSTGIFDTDHPRYKEAADIRAVVETDPEAKTVFDTALGLENLKRQWGVHAAGVIMSSDPLIDIIPIMKREQDGQIVTQFDYPACESLGLIKMDFLGLRNLTIIDDALDNIEANRGFRPVLEDLALDDAGAYELLARGDTLGVFQLDGGPMRSLLRLMKPDNFEDISAVIALYRPGPMGANSHTNYALRKNGLQAITPIHPELAEPLKEILDTSYGLIIYQEQVMAIAQKVAGLLARPGRHPAARDGQEEEVRARQAVRGLLGRHEGERLLGCRGQDALGHPAAVLRLRVQQGALGRLRRAQLLDRVPQGALSRPSTWPRCSRASATRATSSRSTSTSAAAWASRCSRPTSTSRSASSPPSARTSASGSARCATSGFNVVDAIRAAREAKGRFESFHDFLKKVPIQVANKRTVESLVKAGAFDSLGHTRRALVEIHEGAVESAVKEKRAEENGDIGFDFDSLFDDHEREAAPSLVPDRPEWAKTRQARLRARDARAVRLRPPARRTRGAAREARVDDDRRPDRRRTRRRTATPSRSPGSSRACSTASRGRRGNQYGMIQVEDFAGEITVMFMGKAYQEFAPGLQADSIVVVRGRVSMRDDGMNLHAYSVFIARPRAGRRVGHRESSRCPTSGRRTDTMQALGDVLIRHRGRHRGAAHARTKGARARVFEVPYPVQVTADLYGELKSLLGPNCLV